MASLISGVLRPIKNLTEPLHEGQVCLTAKGVIYLDIIKRAVEVHTLSPLVLMGLPNGLLLVGLPNELLRAHAFDSVPQGSYVWVNLYFSALRCTYAFDSPPQGQELVISRVRVQKERKIELRHTRRY